MPGSNNFIPIPYNDDIIASAALFLTELAATARMATAA
jgi:hypothetical protein